MTNKSTNTSSKLNTSPLSSGEGLGLPSGTHGVRSVYRKNYTTMKKNMKLTFILLVIGTVQAWAQKIEVDFVEVTDNKVVVHYDLQDEKTERTYLVNLFSSQDNFTKELTKVSGDVGTEVKSGRDRKITFDITKELGNFKGDISFEVRGRIYVAFVKLKEFGEGQVFKRGKNVPINWSSGNLSGQVNIELYKGDQRISGDNNQPNVGKFDWNVPSGAKKGSDYRLKFTNTKDRNDVAYSPTFTIKPKVPMLLKAAGILVIGGLVAVVASGSKSSSSPGVEKVPGLVTPPFTPDGN